MNCASDVKFDELGNDIDTENFNGAQCKAICVEAGMIALSRNSNVATHENFVEAIQEVKTKKKIFQSFYI